MIVVATIELCGSIAPPPEVPLSALTTIGATVDMSVLVTNGIITDNNGASHADTS